MILLDPYFFPLKSNYMEAEINAQILMMANEYFVNRQQIYE